MVHPIIWAREQRNFANGRLIPTPARHLLLVLASHADNRTGRCWLLYSTLADELGCSRRTVMRLMADLEAGGLVQVEQTYKRSNTYTLAIPRDAEVVAVDVEEDVSVDLGAFTVKDLAAGLVGDGGVLDGFLTDFPDNPTQAYLAALDAAAELGVEYADLSKNVPTYLAHAVLGRCAKDTHDVPMRSMPRYYKEAKVLGRDGCRFLIAALCHTASADIGGDSTSYVIAAARRIASEAREVAA